MCVNGNNHIRSTSEICFQSLLVLFMASAYTYLQIRLIELHKKPLPEAFYCSLLTCADLLF